MAAADTPPTDTSPEAVEKLEPHKRVTLEFGAVLRQIASVMKAEIVAGYPAALSIDLYKTIEMQLEQRVSMLVDVASREVYHETRERFERDLDGVRAQLAAVTRERDEADAVIHAIATGHYSNFNRDQKRCVDEAVARHAARTGSKG